MHCFLFCFVVVVVVVFLQFFESFRAKIYIKYCRSNEEWIESETTTITSDYVLHDHLSIS